MQEKLPNSDAEPDSLAYGLTEEYQAKVMEELSKQQKPSDIKGKPLPSRKDKKWVRWPSPRF